MDCRRIASTSAMDSATRTPLSASAPPLTRASTNTRVSLPQQQQHRYRRRLYDNDDDDDDRRRDECNNNNVSAANSSMNTTTTLLVDELEQLRTDNFQLRLRVYNAERRLDRLSAETADRDRKNSRRNGIGSNDDSDTGSSSISSSSNSSCGTDGKPDTDNNRTAAATAKATAEAAVRTIHDLLTVNRRLLSLLAATVSAKAVTVTADDKRRWKRLRNHIEHCADGWLNEEEEDDKHDDESSEASSTDSETCNTETRVSEKHGTSRRNLVSTLPPAPPPPPPSPPPPSPPPPPPPPPPESGEHRRTAVDDDGPGSELARLRARCRRLERSLQQLVNTELWARNRQIGKLEQQRYVTQMAEAAQRDRRSTAASVAVPQSGRPTVALPVTSTSPPTKGILVIRSPDSSATTAAATAIKTPPPVLPDYSEVNFFFSCDEDDDQQESETYTTTASTEDESSDEDEDETTKEKPDKVPVAVPMAGNALGRTATAIGATSTPLATQPRKRRRHHHRQPGQIRRGLQTVMARTKTLPSSLSSSSTDSVKGADLNRETTTCSRRRRRRTISGGGGSRRRRWSRSRPTCDRCSTCDHRAAGDAGVTAAVTDAQVQCGTDGNVDEVGRNHKDDDQLSLLRRELEARKRENCRLYEMLLRLQGRKNSVDDGGVAKVKSPDLNVVSTSPDHGSSAAVDSNSDRGGSPEPYGRAARAVRSRIADLLPPLLSMRSSADPVTATASAAVDDGQPQVGNELQQQQQQLRLLARLRERIVAYERQELHGGDGSCAIQVVQPVASVEDQENAAVRRMDRATLVNVALPRAVDRLRRALVPLLTQQSQEDANLTVSEPLTKLRTAAAATDDDDECIER